MVQPAMCKFLIQNGADVDELAPDPYCIGDSGCVKIMISYNYLNQCLLIDPKETSANP